MKITCKIKESFFKSFEKITEERHRIIGKIQESMKRTIRALSPQVVTEITTYLTNRNEEKEESIGILRYFMRKARVNGKEVEVEKKWRIPHILKD